MLLETQFGFRDNLRTIDAKDTITDMIKIIGNELFQIWKKIIGYLHKPVKGV